jgi:hypothetical protein
MEEQKTPSDWRVLCELVSKEQDPDRLMELVRRLNDALDKKLSRCIAGVSTQARGKAE